MNYWNANIPCTCVCLTSQKGMIFTGHSLWLVFRELQMVPKWSGHNLSNTPTIPLESALTPRPPHSSALRNQVHVYLEAEVHQFSHAHWLLSPPKGVSKHPKGFGGSCTAIPVNQEGLWARGRPRRGSDTSALQQLHLSPVLSSPVRGSFS